MAEELFELGMLGGAVEARYRRLRPDVEKLPWGTLDPRAFSPRQLAAARAFWTRAAFQEHCTALVCASTLEALTAARAPIDLVAVASRFVLDEMAHVELCARVCAELGGGASLRYDPEALVPKLDGAPLARAAELIVRVFCVAEAFAQPMQAATARAQSHPLLKAVIARIAKDEAAHGRFGWLFLDWAEASFDEPLRARLRQVARAAVDQIARTRTAPVAAPPDGAQRSEGVGWLAPDEYARVAERVLEAHVCAPLRERDLY